jgi:hypothetical protein
MRTQIGQHHRDCSDAELAGAEAIAPAVDTIKARVKEIFEAKGALTDAELKQHYEAAHGPIDVNSLQPRRYELKLEGWLEDSGDRRQGTGRVRRTVWRRVSQPTLRPLDQLSLLGGETR